MLANIVNMLQHMKVIMSYVTIYVTCRCTCSTYDNIGNGKLDPIECQICQICTCV